MNFLKKCEFTGAARVTRLRPPEGENFVKRKAIIRIVFAILQTGEQPYGDCFPHRVRRMEI